MRQLTIEQIRLEGASILDICYTHSTEGSFNVTKILANLHLPFVIKVSFPFNDSIIEGNRNADVYQPLIDKMSLAEAQKPLVLMGCENGTVFVVDGNNRLRWLIDHGYREARASYIPYTYREQFRMRIMIQQTDGTWKEEDPDEALASCMGKHHEAARTR